MQAPTARPNDSNITLPGYADLLPLLRRRARYLARDEAEAEDLVQETLERALRFGSSFHAGSSYKSWLFQIQKNAFLSRRRRSGVERRAVERVLHETTCRVEASEGKLLEKTVYEALEQLPPSFQQVLRLALVLDYSYAETAEELGVPIGTVMSRLFRAKKRLREVLLARDAAFAH